MKNIIFMGSPEFAATSLEALVKNNFNVSLVVTRSNKPVGRSGTPSPTSVKKLALEYCLDVFDTDNLNSAEVEQRFRNLNPDLIVVVAYGRILSDKILSIPRLGCINVHASLLPKYRGASPIQGAILAGEKVTGVTIMKMEQKMDEGDILFTRETPIDDFETAGHLTTRLAALGAELLVHAVFKIFEKDSLEPFRTPQDHSLATYTKIIKKSDGLLTQIPRKSKLLRMIRAYTPWPGVFVSTKIASVKKMLEIPDLT